MSLAMEMTPKGGNDSGFRLKGWHVLAAMLGFFGVTIAVNGVFVWLALDTWTGLTNERAYQDGLAYNEQIEAAAAVKAAGWRFDLSQEGRYVTLHAVQDGLAVDGLDPSVALRRPTNDREDTTIALAPLGEGRYGAGLDDLGQGAWLAQVVTELDGTETRVLETRLWLK